MTTEISFEENKYQIKSRSILGESQVPAMTKFLLNKGIVKTEKTAHILLIIISLLFFSFAMFIFSYYVLDIKITESNKTEINITDEGNIIISP
jgi:hypothetical protein